MQTIHIWKQSNLRWIPTLENTNGYKFVNLTNTELKKCVDKFKTHPQFMILLLTDCAKVLFSNELHNGFADLLNQPNSRRLYILILPLC